MKLTKLMEKQIQPNFSKDNLKKRKHIFWKMKDNNIPKDLCNQYGDLIKLKCKICGQTKENLTKFCPGKKS